jgi:hypothetical protein
MVDLINKKEGGNKMDYRYDQVGIAGDWHADLEWADWSIDAFKREGINCILHLGDFGVGFGSEGGTKYLNRLQKKLLKEKMIILVTLGNHEDYARIADLPLVTSGEWKGMIRLSSQILLFPRGYRFELEGTSFVSLGGANSIDRFGRLPNISWWEGEQISMGDVYRTLEGGTADVFLGHDTGINVPIPLNNHRDEGDWEFRAKEYAKKSRESIQVVLDGVRPKLAFNGHYHFYFDKTVTLGDFENDDTYTTRFVSMNKNRDADNLGILTSKTLEFRLIPLFK